MQRNADESCCTVPQRETTNVLMHLGWPLNTDSSVSFTHRHARTLKCMCDLRMRPKHIHTHLKNTKTVTRHPRLIVSPSPRLHSPIIIILYPPIYYFLPSCLIPEFGSIRGTYLAEEMTSLCLSESRILARWEATESAYWVMWTCEEGRKVSS